MIPSDPAYGGTEWQIAKGGLEDGLSHAENAVKEAIEELGLVENNIDGVKLLSKRVILGCDFYVYVAKVKKPDLWGKPHYETGDSGWVELPRQMNEIRSRQRIFFQDLLNELGRTSLSEGHAFGYSDWGLVTPQSHVVTPYNDPAYFRAETHPELYSCILTGGLDPSYERKFSDILFKKDGKWVRWFVDKNILFFQSSMPTRSNVIPLVTAIEKVLKSVQKNQYKSITWDFPVTREFSVDFPNVSIADLESKKPINFIEAMKKMLPKKGRK